MNFEIFFLTQFKSYQRQFFTRIQQNNSKLFFGFKNRFAAIVYIKIFPKQFFIQVPTIIIQNFGKKNIVISKKAATYISMFRKVINFFQHKTPFFV